MPLLLQLDLASLPISPLPINSGVLQVFYCPRTDAESGAYCDDFQAFSECHCLRVIPRAGLSPFAGKLPAEGFPPVDIVAWEQFTDYPDGTEHGRLSLRYDYKFKPGMTVVDVDWDEGGLHFAEIGCTNDADGDLAGAIASAAPKDKLLGWPMWVQGVEYPTCPKCRREMSYLFQIDSEDHIPHMFGDAGCAHISFCPSHPDVLAFAWACS